MSTAALIWGRSFSPQRDFGAVPPIAVANAVRGQFTRWGRPRCFRVDNGTPWDNSHDLPTAFALWLIGLGVELHWNDPRRPQQNGKVERSQGVGKCWAEPERCQSIGELQRRLNDADRLQRECYRPRGRKSRLEQHPSLTNSGRAYSTRAERRDWSLDRVCEHLSEYVAVRKVDGGGKISVYDRSYHIGQRFAGRRVQVEFDPTRNEWVISTADHEPVRRCPAEQITALEIMKLSFRRRRTKERGEA